MTTKHYPDIEPNPNFAALEEEILGVWARENTFETSVAYRAPRKADGSSNAYVFYDGPPFANGSPHYGHLLTGYVKDAIARYHTMKGARVERRFGWDCHGLPAEMGAEKELGISGRAAIQGFGIDKFNAHCRTSVMKYTQDWEYYVTRQGRWVDFKNDYKTMDTPYMESCLWAFSELFKKGLVYESMRVMPYSWAAETPVSNFETRLDNATREREDKAAYVKFKLKEKPKGAPEAENYYLIAWTTTPWTLPSNLALAVNGGMHYKAVVEKGECLIDAMGTASSTNIMKSKDGEQKTAAVHLLGADLIGLTYEPLFPYFADTPNAFRVLDGSEFVTDGDGTGIVHMAPGFGEVDQKCCAENGIEVLVPVDEKGRFTDAIYDLPPTETQGGFGSPAGGERPLQANNNTYRVASDKLKNSTTSEAGSCSPLAGEPNPSSDLVGGRDAKRVEHAREMRKEPTPWEAKLWARLKEEQLGGFKFRRQAPIDHYIADFVNYEKRVIVELDGSQHADSKHDKTRDAYLRAQDFVVLRFWNNEVDMNLEGVLTHILEVLQNAPHRNAESVSAPPQGGSGSQPHVSAHDFLPLRLRGLTVVPDTRIAESDIVVSEEDKAQHIAAKDIAKYGLANMRIVRWLKASGKLVKDEPCKHNYPHCWRTDTPLIYRAMSSWYVNVQKIKANMAANNETIHWIPDHIQQGQMGKGIESAPDWSISRNRFWGTPIPIWKSASGKLIVPGSIAEIEQLSGQKVEDLHRPFIDTVTFEKDGETYTRVEDVFDCWFESGSMPYAQVHYPFENKEWFEENFPADFITEYIAQTRGWFYTLQVLSAALFGKAPFKNCICHGVVIDEETGLKYSKRLKNYKDPKEVMDAYGADALRWMMLASPVMRGADLGVDPDGKFIRDVVRLNIKPLWSAFNFFTLYANADGIVVSKEDAALATHNSQLTTNMLDRYILAKCKAAVMQVRASMDAYDTPGAAEAITVFFDVLNNWYIRRSRPRFWGEELTADKQAAYNTLFTVLSLMCRAAAPLLPFVTEAVYRGLHGDTASVHLTDFPDVSGIADEFALIADMDWVRDVCNAGSAVRNKANIRNRQPLASLTLAGGALRFGKETDAVAGFFSGIIKEELNVKDFATGGSFDDYASIKLQINSAVLGKRLPAKMKEMLPASKKGEWTRDGADVVVAGEKLLPGEYTILLEPKPAYKDSAAPLSTNDALVILDLTITPELEAEGRARDLVRMIQQARKDAGLHVADRISLAVDVPADFKAAMAAHGDYIKEQTLAVTLVEGASTAAQQMAQELDGAHFVIGLSKVA